jgi:cell division protein FtsA
MIEIEAFGAERQRTYARRMLCEIIQARCEEILEMIMTEVKRNAEPQFVSAGLVLTGGTARLPGLDLLSEQITHLPARIGLPGHIFGLVDELHDPAFAAAVGLLQWSAGEQNLVPIRQRQSGPGSFDGVFKKISNWFRVLLPE